MVSRVKRHLVHHYHLYQQQQKWLSSIYIQRIPTTHSNHLSNIFWKTFMGLKLKEFFHSNAQKNKIFNRWNDNIYTLSNAQSFPICKFCVVGCMAVSWSCKMSFDEGMARDTFVISFLMWQTLSMDWTKTQQKKCNIFFIGVFNQNIARHINSHIIT